MNRKALIIILILSSLSIISCQKQPTILVHNFKNNSWNSFQNVIFKTKIEDSNQAYKLIVTLKLDSNFEANDFSFGFSQKSDDGESMYSNYTIPIKDSKGNFNTTINKHYFEYKLIIHRKVYFNSRGTYTFIFESTMDKVNMRGIEQLKLELIKL